MKSGLLFVVSLFLFYSCGSDDSKDWNAYYEKQLLDEYESFQKETSVAQHLALIEGLKETSVADSQKDVFVDNRFESLNLAISSNDSSIFYFVSADQQVDGNFLKFQHEDKLENVRQTIEHPFSSLPSEFGAHTTGVKRFKEMTQGMLSEICNNEFIVIFRTISKSMPKYVGDSFTPGVYRGRILIYYAKSKELVANMDVLTTSSKEVIVGKSQEAQGVVGDFTNRINEAYLTALQTNFLAINIPKLSI